MGAFVSNVTSPFFRRRKGRVGRDIWTQTGTPPFAGARIKSAAMNHICMICAPNASNSWAKSADGGATWTTHTLPANNFIGNALEGANCIAVRPYYEKLDIDQWHLQLAFYAVGAITGVGGGSWLIKPEGTTANPGFTVPNRPQEAISWSDDGAVFMSTGSSDAGGLMHSRGGRNFFAVPAADQFTMGSNPPNNGAWSSKWWRGTPSNAGRSRPGEYYFLSSSSDADQNFLYARRKVVPSEPTWDNLDIVNPMNGNTMSEWLVYRDGRIIMGIGSTAVLQEVGVRSIDFAVSWNIMPGVATSPRYDIWRYGGRVYVCGRDVPRIVISRNNGVSWAAHPSQLPSATAIPTKKAIHPFTGEFYIFAHDGAVNRVYKFRPYLEI